MGHWADTGILVISTAVLCIIVYRTQKYIWRLDMAEKLSAAHNQSAKGCLTAQETAL